MGATAVLIIHSSMGKRSGAHFNPAITLTYLRLGKISRPDAFFYVLSQFVGGVVGVAVSALLLGRTLASPSVMYAETVPGKYGIGAAFAAEAFMAALLMGVVLWTSNRPSIASWTGYFVISILITFTMLTTSVSDLVSIPPAPRPRQSLPVCGPPSGSISARRCWECFSRLKSTSVRKAVIEFSAPNCIRTPRMSVHSYAATLAITRPPWRRRSAKTFLHDVLRHPNRICDHGERGVYGRCGDKKRGVHDV